MYILDCETKPQENLVDLFNGNIKAPKTYKDPDKIQEYIDKKTEESKKGMSVDTDYADIVCIGLKKVGADEETVLYKGEELPELFKVIGEERIITFNGKGFDFPLIIKYGIKHGLELPYTRLKAGLRKYGHYGGHIDLMEELSAGTFKSLDEYLQIYLGIKKKEIDFATAKIEEIEEHCAEDCLNTEKLFNKFKPLFI